MKSSADTTQIDQLQADLSTTQAELKRREKELRKEADKKFAVQAKLIEELTKSRFALKIKSTHIVWEVFNWNGDYRVTRIYKGLQTGEGLQLHFLKHKAFSSTPDSKFGEARLISEKTSPGVTMDSGQEAQNAMFFKINFPDNLTNSEAGADYAFEYTATNGVVMTKEAADVAYRDEPRRREAVYHINEIFNELLQLELKFPVGYPAKIECFALIDQTIHAEETKKLNIEKTDQGVSMTVKDPLPGFWYLIEWDGPSENEFRKLREMIGNKIAL